MVVIASRQAGARPETIRTRLARFMPRTTATGWSVAWSARTERADELGSEDELSAAEHIGCYGAALSHALAKVEISPVGLRVIAVTANNTRDPCPDCHTGAGRGNPGVHRPARRAALPGMDGSGHRGSRALRRGARRCDSPGHTRVDRWFAVLQPSPAAHNGACFTPVEYADPCTDPEHAEVADAANGSPARTRGRRLYAYPARRSVAWLRLD